ncbi:MAG: hypothetical protein U5L96_08335 [Owenweeksia sp.]|nr:hypothetical protein [Owenweeksia sp.]
MTPCIDLRNTDATLLSFFYHLYGEDVISIRVDVDTGKATSQYWNAYTRAQGEQQYSSQEAWKQRFVNLEPFKGQIIKMRFTAISLGNGDKIDMAIDDIEIRKPLSRDLQLSQLLSPQAEPCAISNNVEVRLLLENLGLDSLGQIPLAYQLQNGPVIQDTFSTRQLGMADTAIFSFSQLLNIPSQNTKILKVWSELTGDLNADNDTITLTLPLMDRLLINFPPGLILNKPPLPINLTTAIGS